MTIQSREVIAIPTPYIGVGDFIVETLLLRFFEVGLVEEGFEPVDGCAVVGVRFGLVVAAEAPG